MNQEFRSATFSDCKKYRYQLTRTWNTEKPKIMFITHNPRGVEVSYNETSTSKMIYHAHQFGAGGIIVTSLFGRILSNETAILAYNDPVGPDNDKHIIESAAQCSIIVACWGEHPHADQRAKLVESFFPLIHCGGVFASGRPVDLDYFDEHFYPFIYRAHGFDEPSVPIQERIEDIF